MSKLKAKDPKAAEPSKPKILIFGKPGVGKTWWGLDFPSVYYIDTEGGADLSHYTDKLKRSGGVYMGPEDGALDFAAVIEQFQALATEKHPYRTVVVDSISKLYNTAITAEAERLGDKNGFGADKKPAIAAMRRLINWVNKLDMNVIFIAHEKSEWGTDKNGDRTQIGVTFDAWDKMEYELHLAIHAEKRGPARTAKVRKTRLLGFPDGDVFDLSYTAFSERYGKDIIEATAKPIVLASAEQVAEVKALLENVRIADEDVAKWFTKAGVETWAEMTNEQIAKCIGFLKGKVKA
jgi:hypothetical protein